MIIIRSSEFKKEFKKLNQGIKIKISERLKIFIDDEFDPILDNHRLKFDYKDYRSINITGDYRLIYRKIEAGVIYLMQVGTHHQLFGK